MHNIENSAFEKEVGIEDDFYYRVGSVETNKPWHRPTVEKINLFLNELKCVRNYEKYSLFLVGGCVNGGIGNTWDIDIVVNGRLNYLEFERFLHDVYNLALNKHRLLVDVRWMDKEPVDIGSINNSNKQTEYRVVSFGRALKKVSGHLSEMNFFDKHKRVSEFLVERKIMFPTEKAQRRKQTKSYRI